MYCSPEPTLSGHAELEGSEHLRERITLLRQDDAEAGVTTRMPAARAGSAASSHARPTSARKPVPDAAFSSRGSEPRGP
jgi:hypothetical protein